jgi:tetratricopeptide (TPR) repeat protein
MPKKLFIGMFLLSSSVVYPCAWDSDTLRDEAAINPGRFDILIGQFAHHGESYYRHRIKTLSVKEHLTPAQKNDLAVAYMRVNEFQTSEDLLIEILEEYPDYYPAVSNRGVLAKKYGDLDTAIHFIEKALAINPAGHMGIGDWYLKMLRWRQAEDRKIGSGQSFVPHWSASEMRPEDYADRLFDLIRNDQTFSDGYFMLGEFLNDHNNDNLAYIAYTRAKILGHPEPAKIEERLKNMEAQWNRNHTRLGRKTGLTQQKVIQMLKTAEEWRRKYAQEEMNLSRKGITPSFKAMIRQTSIHREKYFPPAGRHSEIVESRGRGN